MRTRASCSGPLSVTRPLLRRTRRCRLIAGRVMSRPSASSPARRGPRRSRSITPRRTGSARAPRVRSTLAGSLTLPPHPLHEPPEVSLQVERAVGAVAPVVVAVVVGVEFADDAGARGHGAGVVRVDVVHEQPQGLGEGALDRARAPVHPLVRLGATGPATGDQPLPEDQLAVLDAAAVALHLQPQLEAEGATEPVDGGAWVIVEDGSTEAGPSW